ncbi:TPA: cation transporter [Thermoplasmata archaeon]|nr:cation transporter [Thermoplasmata archaeon]
MEAAEEKVAVARLSVFSNSFLVALKLVVGLMMGSVSVLSEAIHSAMDLVAAIVARYSVKRSAEPADRDHAFGHGKFENLSGLFEGALIFVAAAIIIWEASERLFDATEVELLGAGMVVMGISAGVNIVVSKKLFKVAKATDSLALEADAYHLMTDVWTSAGVLVALGIIYVTGWQFVDPVVAIFVAALIFRAAYGITKRSCDGLLDKSLPEADMVVLKSVMKRYEVHFVDYHRLRTRKTGAERQVDLHVTVPSNMSVSDSHDLVERLEREVRASLPGSTVVVHVEPCGKDCESCKMAGREHLFDGKKCE